MAGEQVTVIPCPPPVENKKFLDLTGKNFGRLRVRRFYGYSTKPSGQKLYYWLCDCSCGRKDVLISRSNLRRGQSSCSCVRNEKTANRLLKHGESRIGHRSREYRIYHGMLQRCTNSDNPAWEDYGGRGIKVCKRWLSKNGFENFLKDMGRAPSRLYSLDRLDNNGPYSPENCRWRTQKQQSRNRRNNRLVTFNGVTCCVSAWADKLGLEDGTLRYRLARWSVEKALTTPQLR